MDDEVVTGAEGVPEGTGEAAPVAETGMARLRQDLALATAKYRALLLQANPEVPEELVAGDTVEAVEASFLAAREVVEKVRSRLEARLAAEPRIGAGAPPRGAADLSALSPREKIAFALGRKQQ